MKTPVKILAVAGLTIAALLLGTIQTNAQISLGVDPSKTWYGYMNVAELDGTHLWGNPWGVADLPAVFSGGTLTVSPNVGTYNPADPYWVNPDGSGNKKMEANVYIEDATLGGNQINFTGLTVAYNLAEGYYAQAFVKEFGPGYSWVGWDFQPLVEGTQFSVSRTIGAGNIIQYGIMTVGPNANPENVAALGYASVALVPEPGSAILVGFGLLLSLGFWRRQK